MAILHFHGSMRFCGDHTPHLPHEMGTYPTVRFGTLTVFCVGVPDGRNYRCIGFLKGEADFPSVLRVVVPADSGETYGYKYLGEHSDETAHQALLRYLRMRGVTPPQP